MKSAAAEAAAANMGATAMEPAATAEAAASAMKPATAAMEPTVGPAHGGLDRRYRQKRG